MDRFEIPIDNEKEFEDFEHEMIDQLTSSCILDNWKREGLRVIRRRTEYVYTPVSKTPFSVALASPSSFGRYYIDIPRVKEKDFEAKLRILMSNKKFDSNIQLYNCSYSFHKLAERTINRTFIFDFCIKYLFQDDDQALAIKYDLILHDLYYNSYNYTMFYDMPNLIKSSFYGTYSGITFYIPVTLFRDKFEKAAAEAAASAAGTVTDTTAKSDNSDAYYYYETPK